MRPDKQDVVHDMTLQRGRERSLGRCRGLGSTVRPVSYKKASDSLLLAVRRNQAPIHFLTLALRCHRRKLVFLYRFVGQSLSGFLEG